MKNCRKRDEVTYNADLATERDFADRKDFANADYDVTNEKQLYFPEVMLVLVRAY